MQFKRRRHSASAQNAAEPEYEMNMNIYAACFPLNNKTDSGEKAAVKKASDYSDVCSALQ